MVYLITYDLNNPGQNYDSLYKTIKSLGSWAHALDSTWFVDTNYSAAQIREKLQTHMDSNDLVFVSLVTEYSAYLNDNIIDWLSKHV